MYCRACCTLLASDNNIMNSADSEKRQEKRRRINERLARETAEEKETRLARQRQQNRARRGSITHKISLFSQHYLAALALHDAFVTLVIKQVTVYHNK